MPEASEVVSADSEGAESSAATTVDVAAEATAEDFEIARTALLDITPADTIGQAAGYLDEGGGVVSVYFDVLMSGYPGWRWTVTIAHVDGADASVLETEMTPGDGALLSPEWVPWVDRLADYHSAQEASELAAAQVDNDSDDDDTDDDFADSDDDDTDDDDTDDDDDGPVSRSLLHSGDLDGVDIDVLDEEDDLDDPEDLDEPELEPEPELSAGVAEGVEQSERP